MKWIFCSVNERFGHGARIVGETEITQRFISYYVFSKLSTEAINLRFSNLAVCYQSQGPEVQTLRPFLRHSVSESLGAGLRNLHS